MCGFIFPSLALVKVKLFFCMKTIQKVQKDKVLHSIVTRKAVSDKNKTNE